MSDPSVTRHALLDEVVTTVRDHTGTTGKRHIAAVRDYVDTADPVHGPGDDGAVIEIGTEQVIACGEAISPPFVQIDPYGAGIAAVLANVNDVAAMGATPRGIVNTVVGPPAVTDEVMRGLRDGAAMYDVPIVGGHLTGSAGPPSLSAFAIGSADRVLSMANVRPGQVLLFACFLDGHLRDDFPFFTSIDNQAHRLARDVRVLAEVASRGLAVAAKDVSMAGSLGSLAMLLEFTRHGATVDLDRLPMPADTDPLRWLVAFPTYAFWLTAEPHVATTCIEAFTANDLVCAPVGEITDDSRLLISAGGRQRELFDLDRETVTGLWAT